MSLLVSFGRIRTNLTSKTPKKKSSTIKTRQLGFAYYPSPCIIFHPLSPRLCFLYGFQHWEKISGSGLLKCRMVCLLDLKANKQAG